MGFIQLRVYVPIVMYVIYCIFLALLFWYYAKWLLHVFTGGLKNFWFDITVERTYPGMVRPFSLDYFSMMWAALLWLLFDCTGGYKVLWTLLTSACPHLAYATHCTLSSPEEDIGLGVVYIVSGLVWYLLWLPSQMTY